MLRHDDDLPPLTPDQQAEAIRLAARLQAEHEARNSSEALLRAAQEAGIDPRFVREAAQRIATPTPALPGALLVVAWPLTFLALLNAAMLLSHPIASVGIMLPTWGMALMVVGALGAALWAGQDRRVRWAMPVGILAVWVALGVPLATVLYAELGYLPSWLPATGAIVGGLQFVAALIGAFAHWHRPPLSHFHSK